MLIEKDPHEMNDEQDVVLCTHAHCSMLARAWSIAARLFFLLLTSVCSTIFNEASLGGISGGLGTLRDLCPIDVSFPVWKRCTACRVRSTL